MTTTTTTPDGPTALVRSFGDVLRQIPPHHFPDASEQVQGAVTAALHWFVIESTELAASHCVGIANPPVPDVMVWSDHRLPVEKAVRPASFRPLVSRLREVVELCERPASDAFNTLPPAERDRVSGVLGGLGSSPPFADELGPLLDDFLYARAWLARYGTKVGYWAYRWVTDCLKLAAHKSGASRAELAAALRQSADDCFHDALAPETSFP